MLRLSLLLFALLAAGCYDDAGVPAPKNDPLPEANLSLPDLSARCGDTPVRIVQDIVVAGRVTTSDEAGNFFRSVVLQEDGTGVELMAGLDDLFRVYPPGCRIAVRLQGLAMCRRFGVVQIGTMPAAGDYAVEAIGVRALLDRYVACETVDVLRPVPRIVAFDELAPDMCGCLVQIEDLTPLPSEEDPTDWKWEGYRLFEDRAGNRIATYTSTYARYAASEIPKGPVTLVGVLHPVTEDLWIEGCVVGNDLYGEFPDALVVEDESGGIEVLIDAKRLYRTFDSGSTVRVYCNGLALGDYGGKVQLGLPPTAEYILDRISAESLGRHVRRIGDGSVDFVPRELSFGEVAASRIATYVRFRRVRFAHEEVGLPFCLRDSETGRLLATDRHLVDERNDTLIVRFAASCTYAEEPAPAGMGTVSGVLDYFNGNYMLRITNRLMEFP